MNPRPQQRTIFGGNEPARIDARANFQSPPAGYAARPGTGPEGEQCATCSHCRFRLIPATDRKVYKCGMMVPSWTMDRSSDVRLHSPACAKWEKGEPQLTTVRIRRHIG